jgi:phage tail sheath protein FI
MASFTYPGVYIQELPSPVHTISGVPTAITAFVGAAARGPLNDPVSISSVADYERAFGGGGSLPLDLAVSLFYQNGGGDAIVVRVAPSTGLAAAKPPDGSKPAELRALTPGSWGNGLSITIDQTNIPAAQNTALYNLIVTDSATSTSERYVGISTDPASPRSLQRMLANSSLITAVPPAQSQIASTGSGGAAGGAATVGGGAADGGTVAAGGGAVVAGSGAPAAPALPPNGNFQLQGGAVGQPTELDLQGDSAAQSGFYAVAKHNTFFNLLVLTPVAGADVAPTTLRGAAKFVVDHRAMLIADAPQAWTSVALAIMGRDAFFENLGANRTNVAVYFPRLVVTDPVLGVIPDVGPSATIAGLHAATDAGRGVWKAAAGIAAQLGGANISLRMSDPENGQLNPIAVNCLRSLPVVGNVVWGARTAAGDDISASQWKYVPIRRLALFIEESLYRGTQWVVFEPNDEPLWAQVRLNVGAFMHSLFRQGAFQGTTAKDAYFVKCDSDSNPQVDIDNGILNVMVGFAPLKPAEFVVIKIQQIAGQIQV